MELLTHIGKYRLESQLGCGAMGVVFKAFDPVVERVVAVKTIPLNVADSEVLVDRLQREAKSVGRLEHPNIVTLYDAGEANGVFYLAMQFIQGETLSDRISRQRWFSFEEIVELFRQICAALDYAHRHGVVHRDIKPSNIMITPEGVVKLTDFGIAKLAGAGTTAPGMIMGTPSYMSPEQAMGKPLDGRSDLFSLGSVLYEMITGEKAFSGSNASTVMYRIVHESPSPITALQPGFGPALEAIVLKALAKAPEQRYQTCAELAVALVDYSRGAAAGAPPAAGAGVPNEAPMAHSLAPDAASVSRLTAARPASQPAVGGAALRRSVSVWAVGGVLATLLILMGVWRYIQVRRLEQAAPSFPTAVTSSSPTRSTASVPGQPTSPPAAAPSGSEPLASRPKTSEATSQNSPSASPTRKSTLRAPATTNPGQPAATGSKEKVPLPNPGETIAAPNRPEVAPPAQPTQPPTLQGYMLTGDLAFQQNHYQDALTAYSKAYQLNSNNREVRRKLAVVLTLLGQPEEAQRYK